MGIIKWIKKYFRTERVLFADLDGTIIVTKSGKTFPETCDDWKFKKFIIAAIEEYNPTHLHIVSNQGGIEKGFVDKDAFFWKMDKIQKEMKPFSFVEKDEIHLKKIRNAYLYASDDELKYAYCFIYYKSNLNMKNMDHVSYIARLENQLFARGYEAREVRAKSKEILANEEYSSGNNENINNMIEFLGNKVILNKFPKSR